MSEPVLAVKDVTVWRGDNLLLDNVSFSLNDGNVLQIRGANGSGKTTLLRIVCGVGIADEGDVFWQGVSTRRNTDQFNDALLYIGHKAGIKGELTAMENLRIFCRLSGSENPASDDKKISVALDALSLNQKADIPCRHLSAGQQRRVSLARLLLQANRLWVLDEPLTSLDAAGLSWVESRIAQHAANGGMVLLTTHAPINVESVEVNTFDLG